MSEDNFGCHNLGEDVPGTKWEEARYGCYTFQDSSQQKIASLQTSRVMRLQNPALKV